jgi:hypothetical protein
MSIKYTPKESTGLLAPGVYAARVIAASETYSMKGDQVIELDVAVGPNREMKFLERLYNTEKAAWKITQVRHSLGFDDKIGEPMSFEAEDLVHMNGVVQIGLGKERTEGKYAGKQFIEILRWMPTGTVPTGASEAVAADDLPPDNIPF